MPEAETKIVKLRVTPKRRRDNKFHIYPINTAAGVVRLSLISCETVDVEVTERQALDLRHDPFVVVEDASSAEPAPAEFAPDQPETSIPEHKRPTDEEAWSRAAKTKTKGAR